MRVFVASSFLNKRKASELEDLLKIKGYDVVSTWVKHSKDIGMRNAALDDIRGLMKADVLVILWPGRFGTNTELGMAIMLHIPVIMLGRVPMRRSVYFHHPAVTVVKNRTKLLLFLELQDLENKW